MGAVVTRHVPPPETPYAIKVVLVLLLGAALALAVRLLGGCAAPGVTCPPGSYPINAAAERSASGGGDAAVSVPTASGTGAGRYSASGSATWSCRPICPPMTGLDYSTSDRGTRVRCVDLVRATPRTLKTLKRAPSDGGPDKD